MLNTNVLKSSFLFWIRKQECKYWNEWASLAPTYKSLSHINSCFSSIYQACASGRQSGGHLHGQTFIQLHHKWGGGRRESRSGEGGSRCQTKRGGEDLGVKFIIRRLHLPGGGRSCARAGIRYSRLQVSPVPPLFIIHHDRLIQFGTAKCEVFQQKCNVSYFERNLVTNLKFTLNGKSAQSNLVKPEHMDGTHDD